MPIRDMLAVLVLVLCSLPSLAQGWTINAAAGTGGTISPKGYITVTGTTGTYRDFDVTPAAGYRVSRVAIDGNPQTLPAPNSSGTYPFTVTYNGRYNRSISASFAVQTYKLTLLTVKEPGANGWITTTTTPAGLPLDRLPAGTQVQCTVTAASGSQIDSVTVNGVAQALTGTDQVRVVLIMTQNSTIAARFRIQQKVTADAGPDQIASGNGPDWPVTLYGSGSTTSGTPMSYAWSVIEAPAEADGVFGNPAAGTTSFFSMLAGTYRVQLTVTDGLGISASATTTVTIPWRSEAEAWYCTSCHINADPQIVTLYGSSRHSKTGPQYIASCQGCHNPERVGTHYAVSSPTTSCEPCHSEATPQLVLDYAGSLHVLEGVGCVSCHRDHSVTASFSICLTCHNNTTAPVPAPEIHTGLTTDVCGACHNDHSAEGGYPPGHFNNMSTGTYPASYVTARTGCTDCHTDYGDPVNRRVRKEWAASGKGDINNPAWKAYDFKMLGSEIPVSPANSYGSADCVRCHTTSGYLDYVSDSDGRGPFRNIAPWGDGTDRTKEVLTCKACHTTPFDSSFSRRRVGIPDSIDDSIRNVLTWYSYSTATGKDRIVRKFTDRVDSNICIVCHTGKVSGQNIKNLAAKIDWSSTPFIDPHNMAAASILFQGLPGDKIIGYEYRDAAYTDNFAHAGLDSTQGPCIKCHMETSYKHRFSPVSTATNHAIQAVTATSCFESGPTGGCHTSALDGPFVEGRRQGYMASLAVVTSLLRARGIYYDPGKSPYFFTDGTSSIAVTDWGSADMMGAAFNLKLFQTELGAWAHNPKHTRQLLFDTIDYLDNGSQDNSVASTVQGMAIDQAVKEKVAGYLLVNGGRL